MCDPQALKDLMDAGSSSTTTERTTTSRRGTSPVGTCCDCRIVKEGPFEVPSAAVRQITHSRSSSRVALAPRGDKWRAKISIDGGLGTIFVTTNLKSVNKTDDSSISGNRVLTDDELKSYEPKIVDAIKKAWNAKPYRLEIIDDKCHKTYRIEFDPTFDGSRPHYVIDFANAPFEPSGRSNVGITAGTAYFNLGDQRSVKNGSGKLEAHEYGHMLGLLDEYFEFRDIDGDGDGLDLIEYHKDTTTPTGRKIDNLSLRSNKRDPSYNPSRFDYKWERDIGGINYTWPAVSGLPAESSPNNRGLMGAMNEARATRKAYIITVAYAVIGVLSRNGRKVTTVNVLT